MQPLHYDLQYPAAKDNSITHAAVAPCNLDAAITMQSADKELQSTTELRATALEIAAPKPDLDAKGTKTRFWALFKESFKGKSSAPKLEKSADKSLSQTWRSHSNTIYDVQLQKTLVYARSRSAKQPWRSHYNAICRHWVAKHTRTTRKSARNCSSKTGSRRQRKKYTILSTF